MVLAAGFGPFAGTWRWLHTTGVLGRLFAEALENSPPGAGRGAGGRGAGPRHLFYGTCRWWRPSGWPTPLYRWGDEHPMAAILGFVGAGGWGAALLQPVRCSRRPRRAP